MTGVKDRFVTNLRVEGAKVKIGAVQRVTDGQNERVYIQGLVTS